MNQSEMYPAKAGFPPAVEDVSLASPDTTALRLVSDVKNFELLPSLAHLERLWCFDVNDARLSTIARCHSLKRIYIDGVRCQNIEPLLKLAELEVLFLDSATKLTSMQSLAKFTGLRGLGVENSTKIHSLEPLRHMTRLTGLIVAGGMDTAMTVDSLEPLQELRALQFLDLTNLKVRDGSLVPLRKLHALQRLDLPNFYSMEEFARLSAALKKTECTWFSPTIEFPIVRCRKCGKSRVVLLTGAGTRKLCMDCDEARFKKHNELFNSIAADAT